MCKLCYQECPGFNALLEHKNTQNGIPIKTTNVDPDDIINEFDDATLNEELRSCQNFLVDSQLEKARQKVFNYAVKSLNETIMTGKLDRFFINLKSAAKMNLAFGFILKNIEDGGFRYFYAQENNTLLDRSKLLCTKDHLAKLKDILSRTDVIKSCSRERVSTKWRFFKLTNLTVFSSQRYSFGVLERSFSRTSIEKWFNQLSQVWRKYKTTI